MPIYAYRCEACGFARDILQKISDAPLTECESCGKPAFKKQLTAAGFQLKGSGWYVTDFRGGSNSSNQSNKPNAEGTSAPAAVSASSNESAPAKSESGSTSAATDSKPAAASSN